MALRIDGTSLTESVAREVPATTGQNGPEFSKTLVKAQILQQGGLEDFLGRLNAQGEKLSKSLSLQDLTDFKAMIKLFLRSTFGQSRTIQENTFWDHSGRPKILARITRIENDLEDLGRKVLNKHTAPLDILTKINEICGLILDLFV
ncbi:MAG TPA: YaaR family protein [Desulfitobacteriaceae bacterium]|nr:YaaR family protein [Desulfitobacteriaceae bacterium]